MKMRFKPKRETTVEEYRLVSRFEAVRKRLLADHPERLNKPLVYWALPSDRRLPLAFLGRKLEELLSTPFEELLATPGVGQKKIASLIMLLSRAAEESPPEETLGADNASQAEQAPKDRGAAAADTSVFDPSIVSEALWSEWRATVKKHRLQSVKLGRIAPTLQALPTVIWHTRVGDYVDLPLGEIRQLKTHGEKRIRAILEVFWVIHESFCASVPHAHVDVYLAPKFVRPIELWIESQRSAHSLPGIDEVRSALVKPLLSQIEVDLGSTVYKLAAERLATDGSRRSVRLQAREMGVTRARVYQLLEECGKVMAVRWPEGEYLLASLTEKFSKRDDDAAGLYRAALDLFYPKAQESAHPVSQTPIPEMPHTPLDKSGETV